MEVATIEWFAIILGTSALAGAVLLLPIIVAVVSLFSRSPGQRRAAIKIIHFLASARVSSTIENMASSVTNERAKVSGELRESHRNTAEDRSSETRGGPSKKLVEEIENTALGVGSTESRWGSFLDGLGYTFSFGLQPLAGRGSTSVDDDIREARLEMQAAIAAGGTDAEELRRRVGKKS